MPQMTPDLFVKAVTELQEFPGQCVQGNDVEAWCNRQTPPVDVGNPVKTYWWNADVEEGRTLHRLLKFKSSPGRGGRNLFALSEHEDEARRDAFARRLYEVPWGADLRRWDWQRVSEGMPKKYTCTTPGCAYFKCATFDAPPARCAKCGAPMVCGT